MDETGGKEARIPFCDDGLDLVSTFWRVCMVGRQPLLFRSVSLFFFAAFFTDGEEAVNKRGPVLTSDISTQVGI